MTSMAEIFRLAREGYHFLHEGYHMIKEEVDRKREEKRWEAISARISKDNQLINLHAPRKPQPDPPPKPDQPV